ADDFNAEGSAVVVLSFPRYCRYRGIVKRLEGVANKWLKNALVIALGGFAVPCRHTRILFCKDTFDYPDLEGHELLCNHLVENPVFICTIAGLVLSLLNKFLPSNCPPSNDSIIPQIFSYCIHPT
ncbi:hypothetical protein C0J52_03299, partial [Blattella germanica]